MRYTRQLGVGLSAIPNQAWRRVGEIACRQDSERFNGSGFVRPPQRSSTASLPAFLTPSPPQPVQPSSCILAGVHDAVVGEGGRGRRWSGCCRGWTGEARQGARRIGAPRPCGSEWGGGWVSQCGSVLAELLRAVMCMPVVADNGSAYGARERR